MLIIKFNNYDFSEIKMVKISSGTFVTYFELCKKMPANRHGGMTKDDGQTGSVDCFLAFKNFLMYLMEEFYYEESSYGLLDPVTTRELVIQLKNWTEAEYNYEIQFSTDWAGRNIALKLLRIMRNPFVGIENYFDPMEDDIDGWMLNCAKIRLIHSIRFLTRVITCIRYDPRCETRSYVEQKCVIDEIFDEACT